MGKGFIVVIAIIALVVILVMWFIGTYNNLVSLRTNCEEGFSTMDVYLKKRFDLIPNLVATVKGYAKHEAETLEKVIKARGANAPMTDEETQRVADEREAEYEKGLTARGVEKLLEQTKTWKCDFLPSADEFGTKYDLGDIMTVYLKKYGIIITARIAKFVQKQQRNQTDTTISVGSLTVRRS